MKIACPFASLFYHLFCQDHMFMVEGGSIPKKRDCVAPAVGLVRREGKTGNPRALRREHEAGPIGSRPLSRRKAVRDRFALQGGTGDFP